MTAKLGGADKLRAQIEQLISNIGHDPGHRTCNGSTFMGTMGPKIPTVAVKGTSANTSGLIQKLLPRGIAT